MKIKHSTFRTIITIFLVYLATLATGCAQFSTQISADHVHYPVSISAALNDSAGNILHSDDFIALGDFTWTYDTKTLPSEIDLSQELDTLIQERQGDAVINFTVSMERRKTLIVTGSVVKISPDKSIYHQ